MRAFRRIVEAALPLVGTAVVLAAVLFLPDDLLLQVVVVVLGILLIEAGVWRLTAPFLPSERRNEELRDEVDGFLELVRELDRTARGTEGGAEAPDPVPGRAENGAAAEASRHLDAIHDEMHRSVDRMRALAGGSGGEPPTGTPGLEVMEGG